MRIASTTTMRQQRRDRAVHADEGCEHRYQQHDEREQALRTRPSRSHEPLTPPRS